jgi:hypothetical protein
MLSYCFDAALFLQFRDASDRLQVLSIISQQAYHSALKHIGRYAVIRPKYLVSLFEKQ